MDLPAEAWLSHGLTFVVEWRSFVKPAFIFAMLLVLCGCRQPANTETDKPVVPEGFNVKQLDTLVCPENGTKLRFAGKKELDDINGRIGALKLKTWDGTPRTAFVAAVLIRADGKIGYRVDKTEAIMKIEEALVLDDSVGHPNPSQNRK